MPYVARLGVVSLLLFVLVTVAVAVLMARRSAYGVAALVISGPFDFARTIGSTTLTLPKAVLIGVLAGLVVRRVSIAPLRAQQIRLLLAGAGAIVAIDAVTFIPAIYVDVVARETLKALEYFAIFIAATLAFFDDPDESLLWNALGLVTLLVCVAALVQEFTVAPSGLWLDGHIIPRIAGPLDGPNQLAGWLDIVTPMLAARALLGPPSAPFATLATLAVTTDALTLSRSGVIGIAVGLIFVAAFAVRARNARRVAFAALLLAIPLASVLAAATVAHQGVGERFTSVGEADVDNGLATRTVLWSAALRMWRSDPGLGVGAGNYELLTPTVGLVGVRTHANSIYLQALAEGGLLLFAAVVWTFVAAVATMLGAGRTPLLIGITAATLALAAHQLFDDLTFFPKVGELWWTLLGVGAAVAAKPASRT